MTGPLADRRRMILAAKNSSKASQGYDHPLYDDNSATHVHEAGHTVAAVMLKIKFQYVTITHDDDRKSLGQIQYGEDQIHWVTKRGRRSKNYALKGCIVIMAGLAAQLRLEGDEAKLEGSGRGDRRGLETISMLLAPTFHPEMRSISSDSPEVIAIQSWAWREACLSMANPRVWRAVNDLAFHLLHHETATEAEVGEIVEAARVSHRVKRYRSTAPSLYR